MANGRNTMLAAALAGSIISQYHITTPENTAIDTGSLLPKTYSTANSKQIFSPSFGFTYRDGESTNWEKLTAHSLDNHPVILNGKPYKIFRSSQNTWAVDASSKVTTWEDADRYFKPWKDACESNKAIATTHRFKEVGLYQSNDFTYDLSKWDMTTSPNKISRVSGEVPSLQVGHYLSKIHDNKVGYANLRQDSSRLRSNDLLSNWTQFLDSKGIDAEYRDVTHFGVSNYKGAHAATRYLTNDSVALIDSKDFYQKAESIMKNLGLEGEDATKALMDSIRLHELYHVKDRDILSRADKEARIGFLLAEFYKDLASKQTGREKAISEKIAKWHANYGHGWANSTKFSSRLRSIIRSLKSKYQSQAKQKGMSSEQAERYVSSQLERELEEVDFSELEETGDYETLESKTADENYESSSEASENDNQESESSDLESKVDEAANDSDAEPSSETSEASTESAETSEAA